MPNLFILAQKLKLFHVFKCSKKHSDFPNCESLHCEVMSVSILPVFLGSTASLHVLLSDMPDIYHLPRAMTWWLQGHIRLYHLNLRTQASKQTANQIWFVWGCLRCAKSWSELSRQRFFDDVFSAESNLSAEKKLLDLFFQCNFET